MKRFFSFLLIICMLAVLFCPLAAAEEAELVPYCAEGYLFKMRDDVVMLCENDASTEPIPYADGYYTVKDRETLQKYINMGIVENWSEDAILQPHEMPSLPNDPLLSEQWYWDTIGASDSWNAGVDGTGVKIATCDTGIYLDHEEFQGGKVSGYNILGGGKYPDHLVESIQAHGSATAGIIAAQTNNNKGVAGLASGAELLVIRVFGKPGDQAENVGSGTISMLVSAIKYATKWGADVINLSLGVAGTADSYSTLRSAIQEAVAAGMLVIASVGNEGTEQTNIPAAYPEVIGVGSIDKDKAHSYFSNINETVFVVAPGNDIQLVGSVPELLYRVNRGTSYSAPMVSALAAMAKQKKPGITQTEFKKLLQDSAVDLGEKGYDKQFGYGLINIPAMLNLLEVADDRLKLDTYSLSLNDGIRINAYIDPETFPYDNCYLFGGKADEKGKIYYPQVTKDDLWFFPLCVNHAKQMGDECSFTVYANDTKTGFSRIGKSYTLSIRQYAEQVLENTEGKKPIEQAMVAMLNYGAAAQVNFAYKTSDLANKNVTAAQQSNQLYKKEDLVRINNQVIRVGKGTTYVGTNAVLEDYIKLRFYFNLPEEYRDKAEFTATYTDYQEKEHTVATYRGDVMGKNANFRYVDIPIVAADIQTDITVQVSYNDQVVADVTDSLSSYIARAYEQTSDTVDAVLDTMEIYGLTAKAYFTRDIPASGGDELPIA